jgi:hypothetical protein
MELKHYDSACVDTIQKRLDRLAEDPDAGVIKKSMKGGARSGYMYLWKRVNPDATDKLTIRPEVLFAAEKMEVKLRKNDHKANWDTLPISYLFIRLAQEYNEFLDEMTKILSGIDNVNELSLDDITDDTMNEIVDVMDFGAMILCRKYGISCSRMIQNKEE